MIIKNIQLFFNVRFNDGAVYEILKEYTGKILSYASQIKIDTIC